jgi:hypothetical protein
VVIEMKALIMMKASQGIEAAREELRKKLVQALKNGAPTPGFRFRL